MQTTISPELKNEPDVQISEKMLRTCVHCGFCNATCPTYLLTGNELEGPRGRIYLIKGMLEGKISNSGSTVEHIDNCLSCLACETTCPSGVVYSHLLEDARPRLEQWRSRPWSDRLLRAVLVRLLPYPNRFRWALRLSNIGRALNFLLPSRFRHLPKMAPKVLPRPSQLSMAGEKPAQGTRRMRVALLTGCAQQVMGPQINDATLRLFARRGIEVVIPETMGCCGALTYHMGERPQSLEMMRQNIDAWYNELQGKGLDAIALNTSGCGPVIREYGHIFRNEPKWAEKAATVANLVRDVSEVVCNIGLGEIKERPALRVAYHDACSLQHGQKIIDPPRALLQTAGFEVIEVPEAHICCGSAGTYNLLKPDIALQLQERKSNNIRQINPDVVAAGNIGCIEQIGRGVDIPIVHTIELLDWATGGPTPVSLAGKNKVMQHS